MQFCKETKDSRFEAYQPRENEEPHSLLGSRYDIGTKRTNLKFGRFGEVRQSNIRIPSRIPFIWKCIFLIILIFFLKKWGGPAPQPLPPRGPWNLAGRGVGGWGYNRMCLFLQVDESMTGRASKRQFTVECLPSGISFYNRHIRFQFWLLLQQFITWDPAQF